MKKMTSNLTGAFVMLLLLAGAATTAISQEAPKVDLNALAARGVALANADPLSAELRSRQPNDEARTGFDIGMAAAEGQTLPGPGKEKIGASLPPAEQRGFNIAVSFSLERNRNAKLAAIGAAIAKVDEKVAAARTAEADVFYWLGFDIATGIFGDPALGAQGNTATGPGSLKIRDSLSPAGQRGFNASVKFHLGQDAPPSSSPERRPRTPGEVTSIDNFGKSDKVYVPFGEVTAVDKKTSAARIKAITDLKNGDAEPDPNEILCRGFRGQSLFTAENSRVGSTGETIVTLLMTAEPGPYGAGLRGEGLRPGECSWVDRPIAVTGVKDRWFLMRFETPANAQLKQKLHGSEVDTSPTAAERFPDAETIPAYMNDPNHYWSFFGVKQVNNFVISEEAYNRLHPLHLDDTMALSGYTTTGHKYWKPGLEVFRPADSIRLKDNRSRDVFSPKKPE